ncbi:MAG: hypothetical protein WAV11_02565 [Minisyncoccia bacterium]
MKLCIGNSRLVLVFPLLGFVIKFPKINLKPIYDLVRDVLLNRWKNQEMLWSLPIDIDFSPRHKLYGGIYENWFEWKAWRKTHYKLLCPTWFSFFGLFNIQKYGAALKSDQVDMKKAINKVTNGDSCHSHSHGFDGAENYCERSGHIQMIDYGTRRLWPVIKKYNQEIVRLTVQDCQKEQATTDG